MKRLFALGILLLCATLTMAQATNSPHDIYIPAVAKTIDFDFFKQVKAGVEHAAKDLGIKTTFEGPKIGEPLQIQIDTFKSALARNPQAIVLTALDAKALTPYLEEAQKAGIPVIGLDTGVDSPIVKTTVGIDNYGAGELAGSKMGELLNGQGTIGIIAVDKPIKVSRERVDGFINTLKTKYPNIQVVPVQYSSDSRPAAEEVTKTLLNTYPNISGLFGINQLMNEGILDALKEQDKLGSVTVVGFDSGKTLTDAIRNGTMAGAVTQDPVGMGYKAIETAFEAYKGETLPEYIDTGYYWYDKSNIDSPEIQKYLYQ